ncbi:MAG: hypothetical protein ACJAXY_001356 [Nonlabens sp.]|jgi:hypothetical protein
MIRTLYPFQTEAAEETVTLCYKQGVLMKEKSAW